MSRVPSSISFLLCLGESSTLCCPAPSGQISSERDFAPQMRLLVNAVMGCGERLGVGVVTEVLVGANNKKIRDRRLNNLRVRLPFCVNLNCQRGGGGNPLLSPARTYTHAYTRFCECHV